ncbi:MAG: hypothetical protein MUE80_06935 [Acidobacteria bacterium]|nr:hypothetical protein [Acidobacteriota bacterium]
MAPVHDPAGELVDDRDAAVADDVVDVPFEQGPGVEGAVDGGQERLVGGIEQAAAAERVLDAAEARVRGKDVGPVGVDGEIAAGLEAGDDRRGASVAAAAISPEMTSGTRASSMRMESASSTRATPNGRWTSSAGS